MIEDLIREIVREEIAKLQPQRDGRDVMDLKEAMQYIRRSRGWFYQHKDKVPHHQERPKARPFFLRGELDDYLAGIEYTKPKVRIRAVK